MRRIMLSFAAASLAVPAAVAFPTTDAVAQTKRYYGSTRTRYKVCRKSPGTTGLVAGGVAGAVVGGKAIGGGIIGPVVGAVGGALAGRAVDRAVTEKRRCYWRYR